MTSILRLQSPGGDAEFRFPDRVKWRTWTLFLLHSKTLKGRERKRKKKGGEVLLIFMTIIPSALGGMTCLYHSSKGHSQAAWLKSKSRDGDDYGYLTVHQVHALKTDL